MRHLAHTSCRVDALLCLLVDLVSLSLHVGVVDYRRANLLVAVVEKLALVGRHGVHFRVEGSLHLQLVVDEKVYILIYRLLVDHPFGVVFIIGIFKLGAADRLAVDGHNRRVVRALGLRHHRASQQTGREKRLQFHVVFVLSIIYNNENRGSATPGIPPPVAEPVTMLS
ncbi:membrane protein [gut metagenome]|uniref:Membrane protein n=1 Tax=gut metagenome TaxID=749906 RepID=J9C721_9ZZZZ